MRASIILTRVALLAAALVFVASPICITLLGAFSVPASPGGFGLGLPAFTDLVSNTVLISVSGAAGGLALALVASALGLASPGFRRFYRAWLAAMLLTNPVFLVLGLSTLLAEMSPFPAVILATTLVVAPLGGLIIEAAVAEFPSSQIDAARSLGSDMAGVLARHVLPSVAGQVQLAALLMSIYAMGFYLLPSYVGLGRTPTLATAITSLVARLGDWPAAQQIAVVLIGLELVLLAFWWLASRISSRTGVRHARA